MGKTISKEAVRKKIDAALAKIRTALKSIPYICQQKFVTDLTDELQSSGIFEYFLLRDEVTDHVLFRHFEVFITSRAAVFHAFNGYWLSASQYTSGIDGHAHQATLYQWLVDLCAMKRLADERGDEVAEQSSGYTFRDLLEADEIVTWANIMQPSCVFADVSEAYKSANAHLEWLNRQSQELADAMTNGAVDSSLADVEASANASAIDIALSMVREGSGNDNTQAGE
ncbi:MAG: hypothetical protein HUK08_00190 [Bacteroidaceae bacterium]|nr:hypothetical protein [Bacteroidaceae bacterium]